ncbi:sigma-70 family RNA polymerase sigma factor [Bacteroidaceae bacterium HV4-6-C5C]|nr:sigma-70 family RNA polymerase sigma factor [Bacteroidaceae bacterium HV4-6-C5C]
MQLHEQSDSILWRKFLEGDSKAYSLIYDRTVQSLFQYGMLYTSDRELVKDCIHDIFVKIYTNRANLAPTDNIKAYLGIALKNTIYNALKKQNVYSSIEDMKDVENIGDTSISPENLYLDIESKEQANSEIHYLMSQLTVRQREIIYYRYLEDMSIDEISKKMEVNYQSVANTIQRSLTRIRAFLNKNKK